MKYREFWSSSRLLFKMKKTFMENINDILDINNTKIKPYDT